MSIVNHELFLQTGFQLVFRRQEDIDAGIDKVINLGVITQCTPNFNPTEITLKDTYGGVARTVDRAISEFEESYDFTCANFNNQNMSLIFGAAAPQEFTQSATPVTGIEHVGVVGYLFQLHNNATPRVSQHRLASIQEIRVIASPNITLVAGEDYEIEDADQGTIRLLAGGDTNDLTLDDELTLEVDYTLTAISGKRLILPQAAGIVKGHGWVHFSGNQSTQKHVRDADMSLITTAVAFQSADFSNYTLKATILSDASQLTSPAGRMIHTKGTLPSVS